MPRGCKKGERRGGRAPGTPNKKMQDIIDVLQEKGFNPVAKLIELSAIAEDAYQRHEGTNYAHNYLSIAQKNCLGLMDYLYPKRKAIEHTGAEGEPLFNSLAEFIKQQIDSEKNE